MYQRGKYVFKGQYVVIKSCSYYFFIVNGPVSSSHLPLKVNMLWSKVVYIIFYSKQTCIEQPPVFKEYFTLLVQLKNLLRRFSLCIQLFCTKRKKIAMIGKNASGPHKYMQFQNNHKLFILLKNVILRHVVSPCLFPCLVLC